MEKLEIILYSIESVNFHSLLLVAIFVKTQHTSVSRLKCVRSINKSLSPEKENEKPRSSILSSILSLKLKSISRHKHVTLTALSISAAQQMI